MRKIILAAAVVSLGTLIASPQARALTIKEGQWSMTTVIRMDGADQESAQAAKDVENMSPEERALMQKMMGDMKVSGQGGGMAITRTQCLTNDDPVPAENRKDCKQTHTTQGDTVSFEVACANSHATGQVTYTNDTVKGRINSTETKNGQETNATIDIKGQYVGPCPN